SGMKIYNSTFDANKGFQGGGNISNLGQLTLHNTTVFGGIVPAEGVVHGGNIHTVNLNLIPANIINIFYGGSGYTDISLTLDNTSCANLTNAFTNAAEIKDAVNIHRKIAAFCDIGATEYNDSTYSIPPVNVTSDSNSPCTPGACSLRAALMTVSSNDPITFAP